MIFTISRDSEGAVTKSRRNELEDLRYGLLNSETFKINCIMRHFGVESKEDTRKITLPTVQNTVIFSGKYGAHPIPSS